MHNEQDLKNTPEYRSGMFRIVTCPVCGYPTLDMYWICEHCGWEYDIELQTEDEESPCNGMSLRAYRELYKTGGISMNVTICSRKAAEELLRTDTLFRTAVISFCDPPSAGLRRQSGAGVHRGRSRSGSDGSAGCGAELRHLYAGGGRTGGVYLSGKGGRAGYPLPVRVRAEPQRRLRRRDFGVFRRHRHLRLCRLPLLTQSGGVSQGHGRTDPVRAGGAAIRLTFPSKRFTI